MNKKMSDAELSRRLGAYQVIERIGTVLGLILIMAGGIIALVQHNLWIFAGLFFAGVIVLVIISFIVNTKKNVLLNLQLGDFFHSELQSAFGPGTAEPAMLISEKYLKDAELIDQCWEGSDISNFFEGEHDTTRFSVANVTLDHLVEERSGPDNDNWMTKTVTVFQGRYHPLRGYVRCKPRYEHHRPLSGVSPEGRRFRSRGVRRALQGAHLRRARGGSFGNAGNAHAVQRA